MGAPVLDFLVRFCSPIRIRRRCGSPRWPGRPTSACIFVRSCSARFKTAGWTTSPFNLFPAKGRHMWRDLERLCAELSLPFRRPWSRFRNTACSRRAPRWPRSITAGARISVVRGLPRGNSRRAPHRRCGDHLRHPGGTEGRAGAGARIRPVGCDQGAAAGADRARRSSSACSGRRASPPPTANCSGATTGSSRRYAGRGACRWSTSAVHAP